MGTSLITSIQDNKYRLCCPYCGSDKVHKSIGGRAEHFAAWGATKLAKKVLLGDYGFLTCGVENEIIKEEVPFQQVCDYCHHTFHARKSQLDAGAYSMDKEKAEHLTELYNKRLQKVKDKEVKEIKARAFKRMKCSMVGVVMLTVGILICNTCEHTTEGLFGIPSYTWTFMFSCVIIFFSALSTVITGFACFSAYTEASDMEKMPLAEYAKDHSA